MTTDDTPCDRCDKLPTDLKHIIDQLAAKKRMKWRGSVTLRFDGSGRIVSISSESYQEIPLTKENRWV